MSLRLLSARSWHRNRKDRRDIAFGVYVHSFALNSNTYVEVLYPMSLWRHRA